MTNISLRIPEEEKELVEAYARLQGMTVSEVFRKAAMEKIEDEYDLTLYEKAIKEYEVEGKISYSLSEAKKELGID